MTQARCPICSKPAEAKFTPFCSRRCADVDLSKWLKGGYAIPGRPVVDEDEAESPGASKSPQNRPPDDRD